MNGQKKYTPINVIKVIQDCIDYDEDKYTLMYMEKYGINNVRGGSFCQIKLGHETIFFIERMIKGSSSECYKCGSTNHYVKQCKLGKKICFRCGRYGHLASSCNAYSHKYNKSMDNCYRCGRNDHWLITCDKEYDIYDRRINIISIKKETKKIGRGINKFAKSVSNKLTDFFTKQ